MQVIFIIIIQMEKCSSQMPTVMEASKPRGILVVRV